MSTAVVPDPEIPRHVGGCQVVVGMAVQEGLAPDPGDRHRVLGDLLVIQDGHQVARAGVEHLDASVHQAGNYRQGLSELCPIQSH